MKRFYKDVTIESAGDGWTIHLDGKPVRLSDRTVLTIPLKGLAEDIADEWRHQKDVIDMHGMAMMQCVSTALATGADMRAEIARQCLAYLNTDLVFYRTTEPPEMATAQSDAWDPWVRWFEEQCGTGLLTTGSLGALTQPQAAHDRAWLMLNSLDIWRFTAAQVATSITGSLILALAFVYDTADENDLFNVSQVEEIYRDKLYNAALHGPDPNIEKKQQSLRRDLAALRRMMQRVQEKA